MAERDPNLINSGLSGYVTEDGIKVEVCIYRLEDEPNWALEVVNSNGTSIVWDDKFDTDDAALAEFQKTVLDEGMNAFLDGAEIIQFPRL